MRFTKEELNSEPLKYTPKKKNDQMTWRSESMEIPHTDGMQGLLSDNPTILIWSKNLCDYPLSMTEVSEVSQDMHNKWKKYNIERKEQQIFL